MAIDFDEQKIQKIVGKITDGMDWRDIQNAAEKEKELREFSVEVLRKASGTWSERIQTLQDRFRGREGRNAFGIEDPLFPQFPNEVYMRAGVALLGIQNSELFRRIDIVREHEENEGVPRPTEIKKL